VKIVLVITNSWPLMGGLEKICLRIAQGLKKSGSDVSIITRFTETRNSLEEYFSSSESPRTFDNEGITTTIIGLNLLQKILLKPVFKLIWRKKTFPIAKLIYLETLKRAFNSICHEADVIHFLGNGAEMLGFLAKKSASKLGAKFVIEPALHEGQWGDIWVDKKLYLEADLLLAHTNHEKSVLESMGIEPEKIKVVTHGVDFNHSGNSESFRLKHHLEGPIVLFLGRKTKAKGVIRLIEAWPSVLHKFPNARLVIAGPNAGKESYKLPENSLDLSDLNDDEKQNALAACDLLCIPSEGESFGMVYFEAWAYGKPVIALDLPPLKESIQENLAGLIVDKNTGNLSDSICQLLADPETRTKMGQRGFQLAFKHQWENAVCSYLNSYQSMFP